MIRQIQTKRQKTKPLDKRARVTEVCILVKLNWKCTWNTYPRNMRENNSTLETVGTQRERPEMRCEMT